MDTMDTKASPVRSEPYLCVLGVPCVKSAVQKPPATGLWAPRADALIDHERPVEAGRVDDYVEDAGVLTDVRRVGPGAAVIDDLREWTAADGAVEGQPERAVADARLVVSVPADAQRSSV